MIETDDDFYVFREYIEDRSLLEFVSHMPISFDNSYRWIYQCLMSHFSRLHKMNISRIPIWPTNIFITSDNRILLTDLYELTSDVSWAMTTPNPMHLAFLAPEFFERTTTPSHFSDIWSLGVLFYYIKTKTMPWSTKNICAMIKKIKNAEYTLHFSIRGNDDLCSLVEKCLVHDPEKRLNIDEYLNSRRLTKSRSQVQSIPLPKKLPPFPSQPILNPKANSPFLNYGIINQIERRRKRKLSSECFSTLTIRCRFLKPGTDNSD